MNSCQLSLLLLLIVNVHPQQTPRVHSCDRIRGEHNTKPACKEGETCIELDVKNFTVYVEDHCDYVDPFDFMSIVSRYENRRYTYDGLQLKTGKRENKAPITWFSRHQIPSDHDPQFFAQLFTESVEIVTMGGKSIAKQGRFNVYRIQTGLTSKLTVEQVQRAFVYKEYMFISETKVVDFRQLYDKKGPFDSDVNRPGRLVQNNVGLMDIESIPIEHIDRDFLDLIAKQCFRADKFCSLDIKTESLDLQDYPVAFTYDDLIMEPYWIQRHCEMVPLYRIRHKKTPPNVIFDFPIVEDIVTHNQRLTWTMTTGNTYTYTRRGLLPIIQPNDPFYDFVKPYTTPAPTTATRPPTTTTLRPVLADPQPKIHEMQEDMVEFEGENGKNGSAFLTIPFIYYMLGYITFYSKSFRL